MAKSKKKDALPAASLEPEHVITESLDEQQAALAPEASAGGSELNAAGIEGLPLEIYNPEQLAAGSSEVTMNANMENAETEASEAGTEDVVESMINLDANLSIQNVVKLYEQVKKAYAAYDAIELDASHVSSVDTAALQLFVALKKDAAKQQKKVDFFQPSDRFIESARLLDLLDILEITYV